MDVVEFTPKRGQYAYTFGGVAPLLRVRPATALRLWSDDAFGGVLRHVDDLSGEKVDMRYVNPQTGPSWVEGAEPGEASTAPNFDDLLRQAAGGLSHPTRYCWCLVTHNTFV
jgi:hypothetical protein